MRRAARRDLNHSSIVGDLRSRGYLVEDLAGCGNGVADIFVTDVYYSFFVWLEIKSPKGVLRPGQKAFAERMKGRVFTVRDLTQALAAIQAAGGK